MSAEQEEVVISGVGGFFPHARNLEEFKERLLANEVLLGSRWKEGSHGVSNKLGICPDIQYFDHSAFGIHRQQAAFMDPMQRLMLERTFEALADAGVNIHDIRGQRIGVFVGSSIGENDNLFYESVASGFGITGHSRAMLANRISYWLNIKGPSCAYDSNWTNGIEVLQLAFDAIRAGHCEAAIIGTTNLALNAEISFHYNEMGVLSSDGSTKAYDADASGYARSDGIVSMFIQRAEDAKRKYATIIKTAVQFNGCRDGPFLDLDQAHMTKFISDFYADCPVKPEQIDYMECYGSAVKTTDEVELNAIDDAICKKRKRPLMIGTVKPNTGHSEASASLFDIAKVLIAMESGTIPATIQHNNPNPAISGLVDGRIKVVTANKECDIQYAAINNIGLSSSYAHCLLKSHKKTKQMQLADVEIPRLVVLSTRNEEGMDEIIETLKAAPYDPEYYCLIQDLFSKTIPGHIRRGYSILNKDGEVSHENEPFEGSKRPVWFVFSGMGSQWVGMGNGLLSLPIFAETIRKCHKCLEPYGVDLMKIITSDDPKMFENILHSFVGIAAIQIALTDILKAIGVTPSGIIGHSVGELGCAYADNCLTAEQMMLCAYSRGKASLDAELIPGMMAAIGLGYNQIKDQLPESIEVACHNGPGSSTISGPTKDMEVFVKELQDKGIFARLVNVSNIAYHSRYIKPAAPFLLKSLKTVIPESVKRSPKWVSTSIPESNWDSALAKTSSAEYHTNNLLSSVLFEEGSKHIPKDSVVIEIAPHGLLQAILKKSLKGGCINIPLTQRGAENPVNFLLGAIGKLHLAGVDVKLPNIYPRIEYPVSKGTRGVAPLVRWEHSETWRTGTEEKIHNLSTVKDIDITLSDERFKFLIDHQLDGRIIYNLASYLSAVMRILTVSRGIEISNVVFENLRFRDVLEVPKIGNVPFFGSVQRGNGDFEIISGPNILVTGRILVQQPGDDFLLTPYEVDRTNGSTDVTSDDIYSEFAHRGHDYKGDFKKIKRISIYEKGSRAIFGGNQNWEGYLECLLQHHLFKAGEKYQDIRVPIVIRRIHIAMPEVPQGGEDVEAQFEFSTGILSMKGLQLIGVTTESLPVRPKPISYDSLEFIPFEKCHCENMEKLLNCCINLAITNFPDITNNLSVTEIVSDKPSLIETVKTVTSKYSKIQSFINSSNDANISITIRTDAVLFIYNGELNNDLAHSIVKSEAFCLVRTSKSLLNFKEIETLATFVVDEIHYSLVQKVSNKKPKIIQATGHDITAKDILNQSRSWARNLKDFLNKQGIDEDIYLVSKEAPLEGVNNFAAELRRDANYQKLKYIFVLDKETNFDSEISLKQLAKNNFLTVYKHGTVGTYASVSVDFNGNVGDDIEVSSEFFKASQMSGYSSEDYTFSCIGINSDNEAIGERKTGLGNIDYAAVNKNHERVMGLAKYDKESHNIVLDPVLQWKVPNSWSMEDACTIPHAFVMAYHILVQKGRMKENSVVLIDSGCSAIGLAAISVALKFNCKVFTTVATDMQKSFLKTKFPRLNESHIFNTKDTQFDLKILSATNGEGVKLIVNCQLDSMMQASIRCLGSFGRFIQLGKLDVKKNPTIGLFVFLKNTAMTGVLPEDIFEVHDDDKRELQKWVQDGITGLTIIPLHKSVVEHQDVPLILDHLKEPAHIGKIIIKLTKRLIVNRLNIDKGSKFICDGDSSYFIHGGSSRMWSDVAEWLVLRGAKKILIDSADSKYLPLHVKHRLSLLQTHFNAKMIFVSNKAGDDAGAKELISEVYSHGPIQGVYILPGDNAAELKAVRFIESTVRTIAPKALFVNFLISIGGICEGRADAGFPTYNIQWEDGLQFDEILNGLDHVLTFKPGNVFIKNDRISDIQEETWLTIYKRLLLLLPSSPQELIKQMKKAPSEPEIIQMSSNGPTQIREVPPVFIVPGLFSQSTIVEFAQELVYPVFTTVMPNKFISLKEAANIFAKKIREIHPRGPYNVVGVSTGGILAIEISKILQRYRNTQVTLVDGAPDSIQSSLRYLGEGTAGEVNLLSSTLNVFNAEVKQKLATLTDWDSRLTTVLNQYEASEGDKKLLREGALLLKRNIEELSDYTPDGDIIKGQIYFIRPTGSSKLDKCGLENHFEQSPQLNVYEGDHMSVLSSQSTINTINLKIAVV